MDTKKTKNVYHGSLILETPKSIYVYEGRSWVIFRIEGVFYASKRHNIGYAKWNWGEEKWEYFKGCHKIPQYITKKVTILKRMRRLFDKGILFQETFLSNWKCTCGGKVKLCHYQKEGSETLYECEICGANNFGLE